MVIGALLGLASGYAGGKIDALIMRLADIMLAFPSMLLAMVVMYDAMGVRKETGTEAKILNRLRKRDIRDGVKPLFNKPLEEKMGHTLPEVLVGIAIGIVMGIVMCRVSALIP